MIRVKRVYEPPAKEDGTRILVDRLWPRGLKKEDAGIDRWLREIAPSAELRKWFGHDPSRWQGFRQKYLQELKSHGEALDDLKKESRKGTVTLLYAARDEAHNNAVVLREAFEPTKKRKTEKRQTGSK